MYPTHDKHMHTTLPYHYVITTNTVASPRPRYTATDVATPHPRMYHTYDKHMQTRL